MKLPALSVLLALAVTVSCARKPSSRTTSTTTTTGTAIPTSTQLTGVGAAAGAVLAPLSGALAAEVVPSNGSSYGNVTVSGAGDSGNYTGPGKIGSGIGLGSGSPHGTYAVALTAAAVTRANATNIKVTSSSFGNSSTFRTAKGMVTLSYAESRSIAQSSQGDYAVYWAWAASVSGPDGHYIHGDHGGWHKGQATGNAGYSNSSLQILASGVGVEVRVGDTGPAIPPPTFNPFPPAASIQFSCTSPYSNGLPGAGGALGVSASAPGDFGTYATAYSTGNPYMQPFSSAYAYGNGDASSAQTGYDGP